VPNTPKQVYTVKDHGPKPFQPIVQQSYLCDDGITEVFELGACPIMPAPQALAEVVTAPVPAPAPQTYLCDDGVSTVFDLSVCPVAVAAPIVMPEPAPVVGPNLNICSDSKIAIFSVPTDTEPKQMSRLGTLPEFGDSHGLDSNQFFFKLKNRYNSSDKDKAYLDYLFKSMGYENGFADAQSYMFSEDMLPVGTKGLLGFGEDHHYGYAVLPSNQRDREAFRILSANGAVVHFMKSCGNYFYGCEE